MIYFVEDDDSIRELVVYTLTSMGLETIGFESSDGFYDSLNNTIPSLILLDVMLPGEDGFEILRKIRNNSLTVDVPVMMVTAKGNEYDKVKGLDMGADDYLVKPFGMVELIARVKALIRRSGKKSGQLREMKIGKLFICPDKHLITVDGKAVFLTLKEYNMLLMLVNNREIVLSRNQILNEIWGYDFDGENRAVDVYVRTLRKKLGVAGDMIKTIRGIGYKFEVDENE